MATVRISNALTDAVKASAKKIFSAQLAAVEVEVDADTVMELWLDAEPGRRELYRRVFEWLPYAASYRGVPLRATVGDRETTVATTTAGFPRHENRVPHMFTSSSASVFIDRIPGAEQLCAEILERYRRAHTIRAAESAFNDQIDKVLKSSSTLKQALMLWPGLWELLPQNTKDLHNLPTRRRASSVDDVDEDEAPEVDVSLLNAGVVTAKILGVL